MIFNKRNLTILLGWLITIGIFVLIAYKLDLKDFVLKLKDVSVLDITILTLIYILGFVIRAVRTRIMLPALNFKQSLGGIFIGYAGNNIFPARMGELLRAQVIGMHSNISRSTTLSNIFVERIMDGVAIVVLLFWGSFGLELPDWAIKAKTTGLLIFSIAVFCLIVINILYVKGALKFKDDKKGMFIKNFLEGFRLSMTTPMTFFKVVFISIVIWTVEACMFYYGLKIFSVTPLSFHLACFLLGTVNLAALVPSSPGALGVFEGTAVLTLAIIGINKATALACSSVIHACQLIPIIIIGIFYMKYFGIKTLKLK